MRTSAKIGWPANFYILLFQEIQDGIFLPTFKTPAFTMVQVSRTQKFNELVCVIKLNTVFLARLVAINSWVILTFDQDEQELLPRGKLI